MYITFNNRGIMQLSRSDSNSKVVLFGPTEAVRLNALYFVKSPGMFNYFIMNNQ